MTAPDWRSDVSTLPSPRCSPERKPEDIVRLEPRPRRLCPNCGEPLRSDEHWRRCCVGNRLKERAEARSLDLPAAPPVWETRDAGELDGLGLVSWVSGMSSLTGILLGMLCIVAGPFTCFMTWILAYYVFLWGLPIHLLALGLGVAGLCQSRRGKGQPGCTFAVTSGLIGSLLSGMAVGAVHVLFPR
jgi:hypothetical protein